MPRRATRKKRRVSTLLRSTVGLLARIKVTYILGLLLVLASFLLGVLVTKVAYLEGGMSGTSTVNTTVGAQPTASPPKPLHVAKSIGIDPNKFKACIDSGKFADQVNSDFTLGQQAGVDGTPATFVNGKLISGAQPYSVFKDAIDKELASPGSYSPSTTPTAIDITVTTNPIMGDVNAPVSVVEFADYQCPFCEQWFTQVESSLIKDYVKTGKVKFIFQNYAFLGPDSTTAAQAAYCAAEQGKFWQYHDFMYKNQGQEQSGWASEKYLL